MHVVCHHTTGCLFSCRAKLTVIHWQRPLWSLWHNVVLGALIQVFNDVRCHPNITYVHGLITRQDPGLWGCQTDRARSSLEASLAPFATKQMRCTFVGTLKIHNHNNWYNGSKWNGLGVNVVMGGRNLHDERPNLLFLHCQISMDVQSSSMGGIKYPCGSLSVQIGFFSEIERLNLNRC